MADCRPGQVLGQLLSLGEGEGMAGASALAVWSRSTGGLHVGLLALCRLLAGKRRLGQTAERVEVAGRVGSGRSGPWGRSDKDGNGNRNRGGCRRASRLGWQRCNRERAEPDRALPVRS
jgi:hypothetical protein